MQKKRINISWDLVDNKKCLQNFAWEELFTTSENHKYYYKLTGNNIQYFSYTPDEKMRRNESTQGGNKDEVIMKHTKNNDIYEFKREKISSEIIRGMIVAETEQFLMLNKLVDGFFHDGYIIVRKCDISSYRIFDKVHFVEKKIQREIGLCVCSPATDISLTSMRDIIFSLMENEKLFSIEKELSYRNILWLIKVKKISSHSFLADELNSEGVWEKNFRHYFSSITKIEFDSRYISLYEKLFVKNID